VVDPSLRDPDGPEPPAGVAPLTITLDKAVSLIGRRSDKRAILPEVSLDLDDGVSHRHALLTHGDDGSLTLRDIGSSNGTRLNGADVQPLQDIILHDGDQITLGRWTRLTVKAV
jgi:pSer/pThr/pTyr-binding forkhead associated (FHA) protein